MHRTLAFLALCSAAAFAQTPTVTAVYNGYCYSTTLCPGLVAILTGTNFGTNGSNVQRAAHGKSAGRNGRSGHGGKNKVNGLAIGRHIGFRSYICARSSGVKQLVTGGISHGSCAKDGTLGFLWTR